MALTTGAKTLLGTNANTVSGLVLTPDHALLFAAEGAEDEPSGSGASDLAEDTNGTLYAATRLGVQVCDRNGRVEGILTRPPGKITSICFGGKALDMLYAICAGRLYVRKLAVHGVAGCTAPIPLPPFGGA